jgi:hypothetical protein
MSILSIHILILICFITTLPDPLFILSPLNCSPAPLAIPALYFSILINLLSVLISPLFHRRFGPRGLGFVCFLNSLLRSISYFLHTNFGSYQK